MRWVLLGIFVFFFFIVPMYALNTLVMPELNSLKTTYANADTTAENIAQVGSSPVTK